MQNIALFVLLSIGFGQSSTLDPSVKAPIKLMLYTDQPVVTPSYNLVIHIKASNQSDKAIDCLGYGFDIRMPDGRPVVNRRPEGPLQGSDILGCKIKPGQSKVKDVDDLERLFEMPRPGTYTIQVSSPVEGAFQGTVVNSNTITVTLE